MTPTSISEPAPPPTSTPGATVTPLATPTVTAPATAAPVPENLLRGGILRFAIPEGPPHSDPHLTVSSALVSWGAGQAYSRLFKFDTTGGGTVVRCDLCSSWEQLAPLTFKIELREGVVWQNTPPLNGRPLTAQDVVFSLNRQATVGYPNSALFSNIAEFTAVGEREILIRLESPDSELLEKLADAHSRIVSPEAVGVNGDLRRGPTVGTGPWIANQILADITRLIVNPDYYDDNLPYLDGLDIQVMQSEQVRIAGMRSKIIDLAQASLSSVINTTEQFEEIQWVGVENPAAGVEVMINTARSPMDKQAVREAMMLSWPYERGTTDLDGNPLIDTKNAVSGFSLGLPILNPDWLLPSENYMSLFQNLDRAKSLLANSEFEPADNVVIRVGEYGQEYIDQANSMAEGLASIGIDAEVERVSTRVFGDEVWLSGEYDIAVGAPPPVSSTTAYLFAVHHSAGPWNSTGYADPEIDRLIEAQAREYDIVKRGELLLEIQRRILAGSYRFIASTRTTNWMFWDYVHDFNPITPRGDTDFLTRVWLTPR